MLAPWSECHEKKIILQVIFNISFFYNILWIRADAYLFIYLFIEYGAFIANRKLRFILCWGHPYQQSLVSAWWWSGRRGFSASRAWLATGLSSSVGALWAERPSAAQSALSPARALSRVAYTPLSALACWFASAAPEASNPSVQL